MFVLLVELAGGRVASFDRVPFEIAPPPNQRPGPLAGAAADGMRAYFDELDRQLADDATVQANWRAKALEMLAAYLDKAKGMEADDLVEDLLGRLLLVAENRSWVDEAFEAVREKWRAQAGAVDPWHRPHYTIQRRKAP